jgi:hypothetical protein
MSPEQISEGSCAGGKLMGKFKWTLLLFCLLIILAKFSWSAPRITTECAQRYQGFTPGQDIAVGVNPNKGVVADFNRDGRDDLAVINAASNTISVLISNPNTTFSYTEFQTGQTPTGDRLLRRLRGIAAEDFNNDGQIDLAATDFARIGIWVGDGAGAFRFHSSYWWKAYAPSSTGVAQDLAVADLDKDGNQDLLIAAAIGDKVVVLQGDGRGGFSVSETFATGATRPEALLIANFNNDAHADVAVLHTVANTLAVLLGRGQGQLSAPLVLQTGRQPYGYDVGDVNHDSHLDLVVAGFDEQFMTILVGDGQGNFSSVPNRLSARGIRDVTIGDLDNDGRDDIIALQITDKVFIATGSLGSPPNFYVDQLIHDRGATQVHLGDLDADGDLDIVTINQLSNNITVFSNKLCR